ncbi:MAG: hypothetical protein EAZ57_02145 [Cytophagales bacterium]|nr:MAG: hypothetical protein EAZ67_02440 [Cytophagales bacterium]TAF61923.1 MAG: hypothetical protein EAZ57_02145 [Cytophagales bacterium]
MQQVIESNLEFRLYHPMDYKVLKTVMQIAFSDMEGAFVGEEEMLILSGLYPRGQIVCLLDGKLIGATVSRVVASQRFTKPHTQADCSNMRHYLPDTIHGDALYGLDVFVLPAYQNLKIARKIVTLLKKHAYEDNFITVLGSSRVSGYAKYVNHMDCETYFNKVKSREIYDPALSFHLSCGMEYVCVNDKFSDEDVSSAGFGIILQQLNPDYKPELMIYPERRRNISRFFRQSLITLNNTKYKEKSFIKFNEKKLYKIGL